MSRLIDNLLGLQYITNHVPHRVREPKATSSNVLLCVQTETTKYTIYFDRKPRKAANYHIPLGKIRS